jgi:hypothetical protein
VNYAALFRSAMLTLSRNQRRSILTVTNPRCAGQNGKELKVCMAR